MNGYAHRDRQSEYGFLLLGGLLVALTEWADIVSGHRVETSFFYLIPIALVTWRVSPLWGLFVTFLSGVSWSATDLIYEIRTGYDTHPAIVVYNSLIRLFVCLVVAGILARLRAALDRELRLARTDALTGTANLRAFEDLADREFKRSRRQGHPLVVAYLDLDNFKAVNDSKGHAAGDRLLWMFARAVREHLRASDLFGRLGGDEFALLFPETPADEARAVLERVRSVAGELFHREGWPVTLSIGAVGYAAPPDSVAEAVNRADRLMYAVKAAGKSGLRMETA